MKKLNLLFLLILFFLTSAFSESKNVKILIGKPNNFNYTVDKKTVWVPTIVEAMLYFRFKAVNGLSVATLKELSGNLKDSRDFTKRISKSKYITAAKSIGATHILYSEYEATSAKEATIHFKLIPVSDQGSAISKDVGITVDNIDKPITEVVSQFLDAVEIPMESQPKAFFDTPVLTGNGKANAKFGTILAQQGGTKGVSLKIASASEDLSNKQPGMYLAMYAATISYAVGGDIDGASRAIRSLAGTFGSKYPKLQLQLAQVYYDNGKYIEADRTLARLKSNADIKKEVLWLSGLVKEGLGKFSEAVISFKELKEIDSNNGQLYLHLANISFAQSNSEAGLANIKEAARILGREEAELLIEVGNTLLVAKKNKEAVAVLLKSAEIDPLNTDVQLKLGDAYLSIREDSLAAASYIKLYNLDYLKFKEYLKKGGDLYVRAGKVTAAKLAYHSAFEKTSDPDIAIMLAELEAKDNNCAAISKLLDPLSPPYSEQDNVKAMLNKCAEAKNGPKVTLKGSGIDTIKAGATFSDLGATAIDNEDGDLTSAITKKGTVNVKVPGAYEIFYNVTDKSGNIGTARRVVVVVDTKEPKVTLLGGSPLQLPLGQPFSDPGVKAIDNVDGDISSKAVVSGTVDINTLGTYNIGYDVSDAAGNMASIMRVVNVYDPSKPIDKKPPIIKLIGGSPAIIKAGTPYEEPGVNATDDIDGDVTALIQIDGEVDSDTPGKYTIVYTAVDKSGNKAVKNLYVTVTGEKKPVATAKKEPVSQQLKEPVNHPSKPVVAPAKSSTGKSNRKVVLGIISGVGTVGSGITAIIFNGKVSSALDEYKAFDKNGDGVISGSEASATEVKNKRSEIESAQTIRNIMYGVAGGFGLTFIINLAIPSK